MLLANCEYRTFISEPFVAAHLSRNYYPLFDFSGFQKNENEIVLFNTNSLNQFLWRFSKIRLMGLSKEQVEMIKEKDIDLICHKTRSPFLFFTKSFFDLNGSKFKTIRRRINNFKNRNIEVKDFPNSFAEFELFLREWKKLRQSAHYQIYIGYDKNFYLNYLDKWKSKLISKFFYMDGKLVGYSIVERVRNGSYNLLYHKANPKHVGFCLYMDFKVFKFISNLEQGDFVVNMGSDCGEKGMFHYKTKSFPVEQKIFECYEVTIKNLEKERSL